MKNKLPRKRKKAFIKEHGRGNYIAFVIINEIDFERNKSTGLKFPKYKHIGGKNKMVGYW